MMSDSNTRFLLYLKNLGNQTPYRVAHLHVSQLPTAKKTRDNLSRALAVFSNLKHKNSEGEIFLLTNMDILFVTTIVQKPILAAACDQIENIFVSNLGVSFTNVHGGEREFYTLFEIPYEYAKLLAWAENMAEQPKIESHSDGDNKTSQFNVALLTRIKEGIHKTNISAMLFNQPVYRIGLDGADPTIEFHEMYISVSVLEDFFCPGMSLTSHHWLFNDLTEDLDTVVLSQLANPSERAERPLSLNVNLSSLASNAFIKFDAQLPAEQRQGVILEINKTDIFENMRLYAELRPFLRERGYRILLDGLSLLNVAAIDFDGLDCDFAKIFWSVVEAPAITEEQLEHIASKMRESDKTFVLAHCDAPESLHLAKTLGLHLVQGRLVDHMVKRNIPL